MKRFFTRLNYSFGNEDWRVEQKALQIQSSDHVLCITASGDRPLHLLLDDCKQLTSIDANPVQNYLLKLKGAAIQTLPYEEYLQFLGAMPSKNREKSFRTVVKALDAESARFWIDQNKKVSKGIIYQGDVERLTKLVSFCAKVVRGGKVKRLFEIENIEEQREFVRTVWDTYLMRKTFEVALNKFLMRNLDIDPGLYSHVDPNIKLGRYIYERMLSSLEVGLAKENMLISLIFRGFVGKEAFPPYLKMEGYASIRQRLDRLHIKTKNALEYLAEAPSESIDRFSMSDIASYMDEDAFNTMIRHIYRTARPGARFCIRQFSSNHHIPLEFENRLQRDYDLEKTLEKEDSCFVYRFMVGTIQKVL